jgi:hypothetical protein
VNTLHKDNDDDDDDDDNSKINNLKVERTNLTCEIKLHIAQTVNTELLQHHTP